MEAIKCLSLRKDYQFLDSDSENYRVGKLEMISKSRADEKDASLSDHLVHQKAGTADFRTQISALFRKNLTYQKRNRSANIVLLCFPIMVCLLIFSIEKVVNEAMASLVFPQISCKCQTCIDEKGEDRCSYECTTKYFDMMFSPSGISRCPEPSPAKWPALLQIPKSQFRAVRRNASFHDYAGLPDGSCRETSSCPVTLLATGLNRTLAERLVKSFWNETFSGASHSLSPLEISSKYLVGTDADPPSTYYFEPALMMLGPPLYIIQTECYPKFSVPLSMTMDGIQITQELKCVQGMQLWRENASAMANEIITGYVNGSPDGDIDEILAGYDFLNTDESNFNVVVWYNGTYRAGGLLRILRLSNAVSNSYLRLLKGSHVSMELEFVKEMPKGETSPMTLSISSIFGPTFYTWIIELLFPVILSNLVYEKQKNIRIFMKMHGLRDAPYLIISYAYFLFISAAYVSSLVAFGSLIDLKLFKTDYTIQLVFYFVSINLQIAFGFLASSFFTDVKTATATGYLYVLASGILGSSFYERLVREGPYSKPLQRFMEMIPCFSLYRGLYELGQHTFHQGLTGIPPLGWKEIISDKEGLRTVLQTMVIEWPLLLLLAYYLDQVYSTGSGVKKHPLWFLSFLFKRDSDVEQRHDYGVLLKTEKPDVAQEREEAEKAVQEFSGKHVIICNDLGKRYTCMGGSPGKHAVQGISIALPRGECFGLLGPNGAGKTSFLNMMTGLTAPTSGAAFVQGVNIRTDMDRVYTNMGVCPQHDMLWDTLSGREHLLFYGRLKNLKGFELNKAVEESLSSVNLSDGGIAEKPVGQYSGGMKRRLSVAISLIGQPQVVYMDEPSTGLDPTSRKKLWTTIEGSKKDRTIILTTHLMEEAEALCDRVGIIVDGRLQCLGSPKELKARYGGYYVLTVTTPTNQEDEMERLVYKLSPRANKVYHLAGTQKFCLSKQETRISDIFGNVEKAKKTLDIQAWGLSDITLEDVFIEVAKGV